MLIMKTSWISLLLSIYPQSYFPINRRSCRRIVRGVHILTHKKYLILHLQKNYTYALLINETTTTGYLLISKYWSVENYPVGTIQYITVKILHLSTLWLLVSSLLRKREKKLFINKCLMAIIYSSIILNELHPHIQERLFPHEHYIIFC